VGALVGSEQLVGEANGNGTKTAWRCEGVIRVAVCCTIGLMDPSQILGAHVECEVGHEKLGSVVGREFTLESTASVAASIGRTVSLLVSVTRRRPTDG
jgi:hypothetical protein